jgi:hypothetical protein
METTTGMDIRSKPATREYRDNWERIFEPWRKSTNEDWNRPREKKTLTDEQVKRLMEVIRRG